MSFTTMKVVVATQNSVKTEAAKIGFEKMFPGEAIDILRVSASSDIPDQPRSEEETYIGARNRAYNAQKAEPTAEYRVGFEAGVDEFHGDMYTHARVVVLGKDIHGKEKLGHAHTGKLFLPTKIAELVRGGMELGPADDIVFNMKDSKKANGALGILTWDAITRTEGLSSGVICALVPFKNPDLY